MPSEHPHANLRRADRARQGNIAAFDIISSLDLCQPDPAARDGASRQVLNKP